jgi:hypothetical protein
MLEILASIPSTGKNILEMKMLHLPRVKMICFMSFTIVNFLGVLGIELRLSQILDKCFTIELHLQPYNKIKKLTLKVILKKYMFLVKTVLQR